ncbi:cysteine/serine-rich nuclear protein 2-like isoform X1 [Hypanus sabinus]|uniref:cysteine/serine-rich nuclear protein 2-like isoform X1 n=2 Tax=Hypanus sabinus TaxID=79690 RepID=UPI0028C45A5C|nr:cysteine/serine-rich nuclear protein 2-like isoform X1 [Hypanus sabinus]XP_059811828.1 cysteine/serine-rich nuclear protein 2-like isoform X1 [Hypanus sabinus]XP_059811829.1 cysteine/serine-rich nuclear protein 2-like isoform X1 [Hypanus sabinus]XP_059811830.1 cysteine/serine-rich nuclear protein 2-like isoform X1 [Hypanus sabinus]XP_059811831.1 cysteine/serine-rich nuclear protein 2-like isoform X1 [Hypanus sabinus]XP_059811832.1 cysteine/serine-rich nuclear protein 2-like isoform X1 [Hypa
MAMSRSLKRRFEEVDGSSFCSSPKESDDDISNSDSADSCDSLNSPSSREMCPPSILKKQKLMRAKSVRFDQVTVYYFTRRQGFTSVPSQGGSSLGMARHHSCIRRYTLCEFAEEQEHLHRQMLRDHLKEEKLNVRKMKLTKNGTVESEEANVLTIDDVSDDDIDVDSIEVDDYFFLQPLPTKRRRALLRASGVNRIDTEEKHELRAIRSSREECGCDCRFYCDPEVCPCSKAGIKCQVDRMSFPCGCSKDGCANTAGRIEFNPIRVRTHYLHTIMKLELENKQQDLQQQQLSLSVSHSPSDSHMETQDYQEFAAENYDLENETAVMHLQSAEEMDRKKEEEADLTSSSVTMDTTVESLEVCILGDAVASANETCQGLATPVVIQAEVTPVSPVLCFSDSAVQDNSKPEEQTYLRNSTVLYYQIDPSCAVDVNCSDREAEYVQAPVESSYPKEATVENLVAAAGSSLASCVPVTEHFSQNTGTSNCHNIQYPSIEDCTVLINGSSNVHTENTKQQPQLHSNFQDGCLRASEGELCASEPTVQGMFCQSVGLKTPGETPALNPVTL